VVFHTPRQSTKREDAKDLKIIALEAKIQQKNEVVAEPLHEHVQLKKGLEDSKSLSENLVEIEKSEPTLDMRVSTLSPAKEGSLWTQRVALMRTEC
jgi:hypothetical protein